MQLVKQVAQDETLADGRLGPPAGNIGERVLGMAPDRPRSIRDPGGERMIAFVVHALDLSLLNANQ